MSLNSLVSEGILDITGGLLIGSALDSFFPEKELTDTNGMTILFETILQGTIGAIASGSYFNFLMRKEMLTNFEGRVPYAITFFVAQPKFRKNLESSLSYLKKACMTMGPSMGSSPTAYTANVNQVGERLQDMPGSATNLF